MAVIAVVSPKGGAGKTTVATHLGVALARRHPDEVAIVDLDVAFGDVASALRVDPRHDVLYAIAAVQEARAPALVRHRSGLHVLGAPETIVCETAGLAAGCARVVEDVAARYEHVVIDTGAGLDAVTIAVLQLATDAVAVASFDVPTLLALRKALRWIDSTGCAARRHVVLNHADDGGGLTIEDVEAAVGTTVDLRIPSSHEVLRATNDGEPAEHGPIGAAMATLADRVAPAARHRRLWERRRPEVTAH